MIFIIFVFIVALSIEGIATTISVIGLSTLFGSNLLIIALAIALDFAKIATVSLLYTYWKQLSKLMKTYALMAAAVTMIITSSGAAGYLSGQFQQAIQGTKEGEQKVAILKEQQARYQERKKQIDDQIASLPPKTTVNQRLRLVNGFKDEQARLDQQIQDIDKKLPDLQVSQIGTEAKAGPILTIAKAFNVPVEEAVKWVIFMIIFVFDPLAIFLIISGNFLWARHKKGDPTQPFEPPEPKPLHEDDDVNVYIDKDGVEHRPQMPEKLVPWTMPTEPHNPSNHPKITFPEMPPQPIYEVLTPTPKVEDLKKPTEVPVIETEIVQPPAPPVPEGGLTSPVEVEVEPVPVEHDEVSRSTLGSVKADPSTIVDAKNVSGYRRPTMKDYE